MRDKPICPYKAGAEGCCAPMVTMAMQDSILATKRNEELAALRERVQAAERRGKAELALAREAHGESEAMAQELIMAVLGDDANQHDRDDFDLQLAVNDAIAAHAALRERVQAAEESSAIFLNENTKLREGLAAISDDLVNADREIYATNESLALAQRLLERLPQLFPGGDISCLGNGDWRKDYDAFLASLPPAPADARQAERRVIAVLKQLHINWYPVQDGDETTIICDATDFDALCEALAALDADPPAPACTWTEDGDGVWNTGCGQAFQFAEAGPVENDAAFCPYCGKPIEAVGYEGGGDE